MAAVSTMSYPGRDIFHGYSQHYNLDRSRTSNPLTGYSLDDFSYPSQLRQHMQPQSRSYQSPNSLILEDGFKPSLPPISNLLGIANSDRPARDAEPLEAPLQRQREHQLPGAAQQRQQSPFTFQPAPMNPFAPGQHALYHRQERSSSQKLVIPPTPPFRSDGTLEGTQSPSTISTGSSLSTVQPYFLTPSLSNIEPSDQRASSAQFVKRPSIPSQASTSPYRSSPYTSSPYATSPNAISKGLNSSHTDPSYHGSGMHQQRALPSNFPPAPPISLDNRAALPTSNPWEHHHYISSSSQAAYPPHQDRYVCQTCNKAFSRPSSLKIHSHSHTGEKPFKCPHMGCGKSFSVRSNMKRHERGCHARPPGYFSSPTHLI